MNYYAFAYFGSTKVGNLSETTKHVVHVRKLFKSRSKLYGSLPFCANGMTKVKGFSENSNWWHGQTYPLFHSVDKVNANRGSKVSDCGARVAFLHT